MNIIDDGSCFVCGQHNPRGLQLRFALDAETLRADTDTVLADCFSGWKQAAHGGIVASILDESMVYACAAAGVFVATATMTVRYRHPVPVGVGIHIEGRVLRQRSRYLQAHGRVSHNGKLLAEAEGLLAAMRPITTDERTVLNFRQGTGPTL